MICFFIDLFINFSFYLMIDFSMTSNNIDYKNLYESVDHNKTIRSRGAMKLFHPSFLSLTSFSAYMQLCGKFFYLPDLAQS